MEHGSSFFYQPSPVLHRRRTFWRAALSVGLLVLAFFLSARRPAAARTFQSPIPNPQSSMSHPWHTVYLPFVARQPPPAPLYQLTIAPSDLAWLYAVCTWSDETRPAVFTYQGVSYDVQMRCRGGTVRYWPKKSWKIDFPAVAPFQGQRELNLNAEYTDKSLLREMLAYDLFARAGLSASRANFARLEINGQYMGVFVQVEQVDQRFLDRIGWDPNGNLYKGNYGNFEISSNYPGVYLKKTNTEDSHADVIALVEMINSTPETDFPAAIAAVMDIGQYLDWFTVQILLGNFEWLEKNYYLYHDFGADYWAFTPWDLDLLLGHNWHWGDDSTLDLDISWDNPIDSGAWWSKKADGKWNKLITEVLRNDEFKFAYCRRLWEMMNDEFSETAMFPRIDTFYNQIIPYAEADPYKWGSNDDFHYGPTELKTYVTNRIAWLAERMPAYCPASGPMPHINELMSDNQSALADEAGDFDPWLELYNPGLVSFDVGGMTLQVTSGLTLTGQWSIPPKTLIPPGGFLLLWTDGEPEEGPLHAGFRLDSTGGALALLDKTVHGGQIVDQLDYGPVAVDLSFGRASDGGDAWLTFTSPTPGWSNLGRAPLISETIHTPSEPDAGQTVIVTALVTDETAPITVTLHWSASGEFQTVAMTDAGAGHYSAAIPAQSGGTVVTYYVQAEDAAGLVSVAPPHAPRPSYRYIVGFQRPPLYLNELLAINQNTLDDEAGESDDWLEIYNAGTITMDLGGMYLTDALENSTKWQIPPGVTVPPGGHVLFWADEQPEQGPAHANFKLNGDGERLALYAGPDNYNGLIDEIYYGPQAVDQPWGRYPDGGSTWRTLTPTPGGTNRQTPPVVSYLAHVPAVPAADQPVDIIALIQDDGAVLSATLYYSVNSGLEIRDAGAGFVLRPSSFVSSSMLPLAGVLYQAEILGQADGVTVSYYVTAQDDEGEVTLYPTGAPAVTFSYRVGYAPPPLFINEFLASNASVNTDEWGEYEDWVELYNAGDAPLDVGGMHLTDDLSWPTQWRIPEGTLIPAWSFLLVWADEDETDGPLHANFKLDKEGEEIGLFDRDGARIDSVVFGPQSTDVSTGRTPDGGATWITFDPPTPGESNTSFAR